jgi:putative hydrolase of the HAD superfamily
MPSQISIHFHTKIWFGFDLDDTLHEFRATSGQASTAVFERIYALTGATISALEATYTDILRTSTTNAFTDGRSSAEYRCGRFSRLLQAHGVAEVVDVESLLDTYQSSLSGYLKLKPGAWSLLRTLHGQGKKILVVTEGPQDAQVWTLQELGLMPWVDVLVTTNEMRRSKVDGLFQAVLEKYAIPARDMVYFGDNLARDIVPARELDLGCPV